MKNREPLRFVPLVVAIVALALVAVAILMTARRPEPAPRPPVAPPEATPLVVDTVLLSAGNREQPGGVACDVIRYAGDASFVAVRGAWSGWTRM